MSATCSACGAVIYWLRNARTGKRAPFDDEPSKNGNTRVLSDGSVEVLAGYTLAEARSYEERLYVSHFATCPDAAKFRARKP